MLLESIQMAESFAKFVLHKTRHLIMNPNGNKAVEGCLAGNLQGFDVVTALLKSIAISDFITPGYEALKIKVQKAAHDFYKIGYVVIRHQSITGIG